MTFADTLRNIRKEKGITQEVLAHKLGITKGMISQYETGKRTPKLDTIKKIAAALGCNVNSLISRDTIMDIIQEGKTEQAQLEKLSTFYHLSTNEIVDLIEQHLFFDPTNDNKEILDLFAKLNLHGRDKVIQYARDLLENPKYKNNLE